MKRLTSLGIFFLWVSLAGAAQLFLISGSGGPGVDGPALGRACVPETKCVCLGLRLRVWGALACRQKWTCMHARRHERHA